MDTILCWIGKFLGLLDQWTGSYIVALLLFAIAVEIVMLPFGIKQQKNSIKQAKLRPKEMAIRKKYAGRNDTVTKQQIATEIQELYQKENFNQFGGCLPLLIQIPVILVLYYVVINPLHYELGISKDAVSALQEFIKTDTVKEALSAIGISLENNTKSTIGIINALAQPDTWFSGFETYTTEAGVACADFYQEIVSAIADGLPDLTIFGGKINLGEIPSITKPSWLWVVPILTFGVYFGSMKLTRKLTYQPTAADTPDVGCSNKTMDLMMPLFSVYITFVVPAAIGVYWIFKSILGTAKQFVMSKVLPTPTFTEEDYKAAEREMAGKAPKKRPAGTTASANGGTVRSLHHIDDDDYLPPVKTTDKKGKSNSAKDEEDVATDTVESAPETQDETPVSPIEQAPLKEDAPRHSNN